MLFNTKQILPPTDYLINFIDGTPVLKRSDHILIKLSRKYHTDSKYFIFLLIALLVRLEKESLLS